MKKRISLATAVSLVALFFSLTGSGFASQHHSRLTFHRARVAILKWGHFPTRSHASVTNCHRLSRRTISCTLNEKGYAPFAGPDTTYDPTWSGSLFDIRATLKQHGRVHVWSPNWR